MYVFYHKTDIQKWNEFLQTQTWFFFFQVVDIHVLFYNAYVFEVEFSFSFKKNWMRCTDGIGWRFFKQENQLT